MRGGRGFVLFGLCLLCLHSTFAITFLTCPSSVEVGEPFTVVVTHPDATKINLSYPYQYRTWHQNTGPTASFSIEESEAAANVYVKYWAKALVGSSWVGDSSDYCEVHVITPDSPGSVSASPASRTIVLGQSASFTVSAADADGIYWLYLMEGTATRAVESCSVLGGYPVTCSKTLSADGMGVGVHTLFPRMKDKWGNSVDGSTVSVTVTDPCASLNCDDGKECTTDSCVNGECVHAAKDDGVLCSIGKCLDGVCLPLCTSFTGARCSITQPANSVLLDGFCTASTPICSNCPLSFPIYNPATNACIAGSTCSLGETQCEEVLGTYRTRSCVDLGGYYDWGAWTSCGKGEVCIGAVCGLPTADTCSYGGTTYSIGQTRCDGTVLFTCILLGGATWDGGNQCPLYCAGSGGAASCVACIDTTHCDDTNVCTSDICSGGSCTFPAGNEGGACSPPTGGTCQGGTCTTTTAPSFSLQALPFGSKVVGVPFTLLASVSNYVGSFWFQPMHQEFTCGGSCTASISHQENAPATYHYYLEDAQGTSYQPISVVVSCPAGTTWNGTHCAASCSNTCAVLNSRQCVAGAQAVEQCQQVQTCLQWVTIEYCDGTIPYCDNGVCVECSTASHCFPGSQCENNVCVPSPNVLSADPANIRTQEGTDFWTTISISPAVDFDLYTSGFDIDPPDGDPPYRLEGVSYAPGTWTLTLEAYSGGTRLDDLDVSIAITCNPAKACCTPGQTHYWPVNTVCTYSGDPSGGICDEDGYCVENCVPTSVQACDGDELWYMDSCSNFAGFIQDCTLTAQECREDPTPGCYAPSQSCSGTYAYFCRDDNVYRRDLGCGRIFLYDDCVAIDRVCEATNDGAICVERSLCYDHPGTIACDNACIDPLTDWGNCGGCGRQCASNQQCVEGMCTDIAGCVVICNNNDMCRENELCIHPGSCTKSECQPINVLEQQPLTELFREGLILVNTTIDGNRYAYTVTNLAGTPLENVSITTEFKKLIASSAQYLQVSGVDYSVLEDDPILAFEIPTLVNEAHFTVTTPKTLTEDDLSLTTILGISYSDLLALWNRTKDALTIGLNSEFDGENTKFHLTLNPNKGLNGVSVPIEIPKCMAQYAADMNLQGNYRVIKDDPLIVWQFDELKKPTEITFSVKGDIDEDCKAQLRAMALANRIGKPLNPWFAVLLIPLIGTLLIFFQRFTPQQHEKLNKKEFLELAKGQGQSQEDALREWQDYKRRF